MRVSREKAGQNRADVIRTASQGFRERGFDGISIAEIMKAAGLTHGGFYGQFASKEELVGEAVGQGFETSRRRWQQVLTRGGDKPLAALADFYLSAAHRDQPADGCVLAALASDAARSGPGLRGAFRAGAEGLLATLQETGESRERALGDLALLVGTLVLARSVDDASLSEEFLAAARQRLRETPAG